MNTLGLILLCNDNDTNMSLSCILLTEGGGREPCVHNYGAVFGLRKKVVDIGSG